MCQFNSFSPGQYKTKLPSSHTLAEHLTHQAFTMIMNRRDCSARAGAGGVMLRTPSDAVRTHEDAIRDFSSPHRLLLYSIKAESRSDASGVKSAAGQAMQSTSIHKHNQFVVWRNDIDVTRYGKGEAGTGSLPDRHPARFQPRGKFLVNSCICGGMMTPTDPRHCFGGRWTMMRNLTTASPWLLSAPSTDPVAEQNPSAKAQGGGSALGRGTGGRVPCMRGL